MTAEYFGPPLIESVLYRWGIKVFHRATSVSIWGNEFQEADLESLIQLKSLQTLRIDAPDVTASMVAQLRHALPDCKVNEPLSQATKSPPPTWPKLDQLGSTDLLITDQRN